MPPNGHKPSPGQLRVAAHSGGPLLVTGPAGSGRSEALALRLEALVSAGLRPEAVLVLTRSRAARATLRDRAEMLLDRPHEELWIHTYAEAAERLLREFSTEAGLDPFFTTVGAADRLAILLDRLDELPLRRHEIRGNPAGLLARLLRRIDLLKAEAVSPAALREWAVRGASVPPPAPASASAPSVRSSSPSSTRATTGSCVRQGASTPATWCSSSASCSRTAPTSRESVAARFQHLLADELEDAGAAHRRMLDRLAIDGDLVCAGDPEQATRRFRGAGEAALEAFRAAHPQLAEIELGASLREPETTRFWRCENDRAQAQAVAREIEQLLAAGEVRPEAICVLAGSGWREGRLIAAALEERSVPFRFAGDAAFFGRPEVRDALAWLRMLADPSDAAAVVRALTRPPIDLRSVDLAKVTTIARRRKLDMVSALEAALESPQLPPEARDRIKAFLGLYGGGLEGARADACRRLRPPLDRARRPAPPATVRGQPGDGRAAGQPLAARRARRGLVAARATRLGTRLRPPHRRRRRRRRARRRGLRARHPGRRPARRARAGQGARVRPRLPARAAKRRRCGSTRRGRLDPGVAAR